MASNRLAGKQYTGYPAQIFVEMEKFGYGTQTHVEKITILDKWYSHLRAKLPIDYTKRNKNIDYNEKIDPKMQKVNDTLLEAWDVYHPSMEGLDSCNPEEKLFILLLRGIYIDLDEITAESGIIDREGFESGEEVG